LAVVVDGNVNNEVGKKWDFIGLLLACFWLGLIGFWFLVFPQFGMTLLAPGFWLLFHKKSWRFGT
jgi:hypothetical protein